MVMEAVRSGLRRRRRANSATARHFSASSRLHSFLLFAAFIGLWEVIVLISDINPMLFPAPGAVAEALGSIIQDGSLLPALSETLSALAIGFALGVLVGFSLGLLIGSWPKSDTVAQPYLWGFYSTPDIAFVPVLIIWFGFDLTTKVVMVSLGVAVPMAIAVRDGVRGLDNSTLQAAVSFCARNGDVIRKIVIPGILPSVGNGVRNGISKGFTGVLVVEMTVGTSGLGREVIYAMRDFDMPRMFAFVSVMVVIAICLIVLSRRLERYTSRWREEVSL